MFCYLFDNEVDNDSIKLKLNIYKDVMMNEKLKSALSQKLKNSNISMAPPRVVRSHGWIN
ncbi:hypothetical protein AKG98_1573 [Moritella sp. JT01]|nr:hypothetical protein AKG98_1573 [Moritella sp. JT01]